VRSEGFCVNEKFQCHQLGSNQRHGHVHTQNTAMSAYNARLKDDVTLQSIKVVYGVLSQQEKADTSCLQTLYIQTVKLDKFLPHFLKF